MSVIPIVDSMRSTAAGLVILWRPSEDAAQRIMCAPSWSAALARFDDDRRLALAQPRTGQST